MSHLYCCPQCNGSMRRMSRNLDFFCRACYTSVVVIDDRWVEVMGIEDEKPRVQPIMVCQPRRGTEPLAPVRATGVLTLAS